MVSNNIKRIIVCTLVTVMVGATFIGCTNKENDGTSNEIVENNEANSNGDKEDSNKENIVESDNTNNEDEKSEMERFTLYSKDVDTDEETIIGSVEIEKDSKLEHKLNTLAQELSEVKFSGLPIVLSDLKIEDGKTIAVFDLQESKDNVLNEETHAYENTSWRNHYFGGSAGGSVTEYTLINTLLQRKYEGEWIDGVAFTYDGDVAGSDHTPGLMEVTYR